MTKLENELPSIGVPRWQYLLYLLSICQLLSPKPSHAGDHARVLAADDFGNIFDIKSIIYEMMRHLQYLMKHFGGDEGEIAMTGNAYDRAHLYSAQ